MNLQILKVILWPIRETLPNRIVEFKENKLNIITGESGTGKSSLTWIIDYCLGSGKCSIPIGLIRDKVAWFGIHIKLESTEMLIARKNPQHQQSTEELYIYEGNTVDLVKRPETNANRTALKNRLNQLSGLPSLDFNTGDVRVGYHDRPSIRDIIALNFQPQHIIANPYALFFKADTTEHRERMKVILPLVLNIISPKNLAMQRELDQLFQEHSQLQRELSARQAAKKAWQTEILSFYSKARELGLLPDSPGPDENWTLERYIDELSKIQGLLEANSTPVIKVGSTNNALGELTVLINEENIASRDLGLKRMRASRIRELSQASAEYESLLAPQEDRFSGLGWFQKRITSAKECPLCGSNQESALSQLSQLENVEAEVKGLISSFRATPLVLDKELQELSKSIQEIETALNDIRARRRVLEDRSKEVAQERHRLSEVYRVAGQIEQSLKNVAASSVDGELSAKIMKLETRISELRKLLDPEQIKSRKELISGKISNLIAHYGKALKLEHIEEAPSLDLQDLTVRFISQKGRKDYLWEIGSGQNWVGYHIAAILALHEYLSSLSNNFVPNFLMLDQPSQVYFPEAWPSAEVVPERDSNADKQSADIEGVKRIFSALDMMLVRLNAAKKNFQIIVTEHAGDITWLGLANVHFVGNWRDGKDDFLIPKSWM